MEQKKLDTRLDPRLQNDCITLGHLDQSLVLLMNNSLIPWLILVPKSNADTAIDEFDLLPRVEQITIIDQTTQLSAFLRHQFKFDKLNIATIGNIVRQLHIHIVARSTTDHCWPDVVWGNAKKTPWLKKDITLLIKQLETFLPANFRRI